MHSERLCVYEIKREREAERMRDRECMVQLRERKTERWAKENSNDRRKYRIAREATIEIYIFVKEPLKATTSLTAGCSCVMGFLWFVDSVAPMSAN